MNDAKVNNQRVLTTKPLEYVFKGLLLNLYHSPQLTGPGQHLLNVLLAIAFNHLL